MWNRLIEPTWIRNVLWLVVAAGLLASLTLAWLRVQTEQTANTVDIVFDYQDLVDVARYKTAPHQYVEEELDRLADVGVSSLAVHESSLERLQMERRIQLFSTAEAMLLTRQPDRPHENFTYILFNDPEEQAVLEPLIEQGFSLFNIEVSDWQAEGRDGMVIEMPIQQALITPLDPSPISMDLIASKGLHIVVRLSDNRPYDAQHMERLLAELGERGVRWIVFSGEQVTGFEDEAKRQTMTAMAQAMNRHGIGLAVIELNAPQKGVANLSWLTDYRTVRLHSVPEAESSMEPERMADRLVLAAKDRNIRMLYLNAEAQRDTSRAQVKDTVDNVYKALAGSNGAVERLKHEGFTIGQAEPFRPAEAAWSRVFTLIALLGAIALIALTIGTFVPALLLPVAALGYIGAAGLYVLSSTVLLQLAALGAAVCAPALAGIFAIRACRRVIVHASASEQEGVRRPVWRAVRIWLAAFAVSLIGAGFVVGLLHSIPYLLVLEQFRGVTILKLAPIAIVALYYFFFADTDGLSGSMAKMRAFLKANIKVGYVMAAGILGLAGLYYLSRSGNQGQQLPLESMVRAFLEQTLGARPRTQEFLIGHPLFLVGTWLALKYRKGLFILIFAIIGMLTMVGTFTHIHTPLWISGLRTAYGLLLGAVIGLMLIGIVELIMRGIRRWKRAN